MTANDMTPIKQRVTQYNRRSDASSDAYALHFLLGSLDEYATRNPESAADLLALVDRALTHAEQSAAEI